ncbi:hypothetical protein BAnh1_12700 [Bartonella australis AUST/NH1]|uniref:Lectin-like protein BA14k n=1 Tax=Bartonella australis (strain Aust/NH1) TaxID=1094489 RepID=M1P0G3_BARAA|nr:BA14K family protein [Bartonella australis]AGF75137.1 hypothetical protein BAnh1_12700 [Bartonella australis AUST/NH1]
MRMIRNLCYSLVIMTFGVFFIITTNIAGSIQKSSVEVEMIPQTLVQESLVPLVFTGRKELNGFKGYYNYRRGYRRYSDGWWYPETAFTEVARLDIKRPSLEATLALKKPDATPSLGKREPWMLKEHINSCIARYRSYNQNDNSYQPFHGPRRQCFSRVFPG